jgi:hypothetical protein
VFSMSRTSSKNRVSSQLLRHSSTLSLSPFASAMDEVRDPSRHHPHIPAISSPPNLIPLTPAALTPVFRGVATRSALPSNPLRNQTLSFLLSYFPLDTSPRPSLYSRSSRSRFFLPGPFLYSVRCKFDRQAYASQSFSNMLRMFVCN